MAELVLLPLFPLSLVACPCEPVSLHIFEERYKQMMADIQGQAGSPCFGILLQDERGLAHIGCRVELTEVVNRYPGGELDIRTCGRDRFEVLNYVEDRPYLRGEIRSIADVVEEIDQERSERVMQLHDTLVGLADGKVLPLSDRCDCRVLSYKMAHSSGLCLQEKQRLLECCSENERLDLLEGHFSKLIPRLQEAKVLRERICQNGHFVRPPGASL